MNGASDKLVAPSTKSDATQPKNRSLFLTQIESGIISSCQSKIARVLTRSGALCCLEARINAPEKSESESDTCALAQGECVALHVQIAKILDRVLRALSKVRASGCCVCEEELPAWLAVARCVESCWILWRGLNNVPLIAELRLLLVRRHLLHFLWSTCDMIPTFHVSNVRLFLACTHGNLRVSISFCT